MNILTIDTAEDIVSAGLRAGGTYYTQADAGHSCAELLIDMIDTLLKFARIEREEVDLFVSLQGPGSWTGLRIGFATVQALSFALQKPYILLPTLDCIAHSHTDFEGITIPALDAKQQRFYCAVYRKAERVSEYLDASPETIARLIGEEQNVFITGSGAPLLVPKLMPLCPHNKLILDTRCRAGRALDMLALLERNPPRDTTETELLYLRKSDAELKFDSTQ